MQAIILAAGMGKRLGELTKTNTKCMIKVNGQTLIDRMMKQLVQLRLSRVVLVIGFEGEKLKKYIQDQNYNVPITFVINPIYNTTNNIYSLYLAKKYLEEDDTILLESDLILEDSLFQKLLNNPFPNLALVAKYQHMMDGTVVKLDQNNNIIQFIPKKDFVFSERNNYYKTLNVYKFSKEFCIHNYNPFLEAYSTAFGNNEYYEQVLRVITFLDKSEFKALPIADEKWYEIDDIQDLNIAEAIFAEKGDQLKKIQKRYGGYWRFPKLIDFCYLVNPFFPTPKFIEELKANFTELLTEYPSGMEVNSQLAGKYFHINSNYICIGNGAAELIKALFERIANHEKVGIITPTFEEYPNRLNQAQIVSYTPTNKDLSYTEDDIITFYENKNLQYLLIINPDNPSGNFININGLLKLIQWTKKNHIKLVVDESFVDFAENYPNNTLIKSNILTNNEHLIIIKSISKSYGVPGLRLGVLISSNMEMIRDVKKDVSIWNINSFAEFYLQIYGKYEKDYELACEMFCKERERFYQELRKVRYLRIIPSQANYFLCEVISEYSSKEITTLLFEQYNILIKDCSCKIGLTDKSFIRIAIKDRESNNSLLKALRKLE